MKVFLLKEIPNLGHRGEIVDVSEGYARNFLIVRKFAEVATPQIIARVQSLKTKENRMREEKIKEASEMAKLLSNQVFKFKVKVGKNGEIFSSVNQDDVKEKIAEFIRGKGSRVLSEEDIQLESKPIKELGTKNIEISIGKGEYAKKSAVNLEIISDD